VRITAATFAPGQEGAFWIAVAGHGVSIEALPFKYLALPSDSRVAQRMQLMEANYDPYPCCASCHNELTGAHLLFFSKQKSQHTSAYVSCHNELTGAHLLFFLGTNVLSYWHKRTNTYP